MFHLYLPASAGFSSSDHMFYTSPEKRGTIAIKPKSLKQFQNEIKARQNEISALNRQQYENMLRGIQTDKFDAAIAQQEAKMGSADNFIWPYYG